VLKNVIKFLSFPDLLKARAVCSTWKIEADFALRNRIYLSIKGAKHMKKFMKDIPSSDNLTFGQTFTLDSIHLDNFMSFYNTFGAQITSLRLRKCDWKTATMRIMLFEKLPNLRILELSTDKSGSHRHEPLLPMSFVLPFSGSHYNYNNPLAASNLRELNIAGDFSTRTDLFYGLLKSSSSLEIIRLSKYHTSQDDLFGTWLTEIILSCGFPHLKCLELECTLMQSQIDLLIFKEFPLRRLCIDFDIACVQNTSIEQIMDHFPSLESVEFGVENLSHSIVQSIVHKYQGYKCWIAMHRSAGPKINFPNHEYALQGLQVC
jgi:hypothetical protein